MIFPVPEDAKPVILGPDPVAVQEKLLPAIPDVNRMLVVWPEQMEGVVELMMILGKGFIVTVKSCSDPLQEFRVGVT